MGPGTARAERRSRSDSPFFPVITLGRITLAFSVMFGALREGFTPRLTGLDPLYFSFVTIMALGPG